MRKGLVALAIGHVLAIFPAHAGCVRDCNSSCCREIRITPWDRNTVCDPGCKLSCEAANQVCHATGGNVQLPIAPSPVNEAVKLMEQGCAVGFEAVTKYVIVSQGFYPAGSDKALTKAKDDIINAGVHPASAFDGVNIRWCNLRPGINGMTPDRDLVCISDYFLSHPDPFRVA